MNYLELKDLLNSFPAIIESKGEDTCYKLLSNLLVKYAEKRKNYSKEQEKEEIQIFQDLIFPLLKESEFAKYILERPRGYIGDFVSQEMIWFGRTNGKYNKYNGSTPTGKIINALTFEMNNIKANEERIYILKQIIQNEGNKIASIGCGSAIELWDFEEYKREIEDIFLLDFDIGALNRAKEKVKSNFANIQFNQDNILKFILAEKNSLLTKRDLIYVFGLFDYFGIKNSKRIVDGLWKFIDSQGLLVITNAHPDNPTRFWMEYGGNWFLEYKTKEELFSLTDNLSNVANVEITNDHFGVYQYLKIRKE